MLHRINKMLDIIKWRPRKTKKYRKILFVLGILICIAGTAVMFDGAILGETITNVATVLGIGLIATQKRTMNDGGE
jgi:hypothetical protein